MYHSPQRTGPLQQKYENDLKMFPDENHEPFLDIIEHPKPRGFRFRYSCEGPSHGGIPGASSDKNKKTYPAVQIRNYTGYARIVVQLVTNEENPRLHPHSLVGKQCQNGICTVQCGPKDMTATFPNLGIQHVTKKNVAKILEERYLAAEMQLSTLGEGISIDVQNAIKDEDRNRIQAKAVSEAKSIDLSVVRLMFIAYLPDANGSFTLMLKPVISDAIFDSKSPNAATLKICRMDRSNGSAQGKDEVYLLCDKVQKDDIQVRFYEEDEFGDELWEAMGDFSPTDVHRQFAIVFRTPRYKDLTIKEPVNVMVQLRRKSDGEVSDPRPFTYMPIKEDPEEIHRKRRKVNAHFMDHVVGNNANGAVSQGASNGTRYNAGNFVFQTNGGGNSQNMKQRARYGPPPKGPDPQRGPVDPTVLLRKMNGPMKQEPKSPRMMNGMNGVPSPVNSYHSMVNGINGAPSPTNSYHSMVNSPQGSLSNSQGLSSPMHMMNVSSPANSDHNTAPVMMQSAELNMIPGTQIPIPNSLSTYVSQPQQQYMQFSQTTAQAVPTQVNVQGEYVVFPLPAGSTQNALFYDPNTVNGQTAETFAMEEIVQQGDVLNDIIAITQSHMTDSTQTVTGTGKSAAHVPQAEVMELLKSLIQPDSTVEETEPAIQHTVARNKEDFAEGMRDTTEIPEIKVEIASSEGLRLESDNCAFKNLRAVDFGNDTPVKAVTVQPKEEKRQVTVQDTKPQTATSETTVERKTAVPNRTDEMKLKNEPAPEIINRLDRTTLEKLLLDITLRTTKAMQDFAATGDIRIILATQRRLTDVRDSDGDTCLHLAVIHGQDEVLLALIELIQTIPGSTEILNRYNDSQLTALHIAIHCENAKAVKWLVDAGADTSIGDSKGNSAFHLACSTCQADVLEYLLMRTQDFVDPHNFNGLTPLHLLAGEVSEEARHCISVLVKSGYDVDVGDMKSGRTTLHIATEENNMIMAGYLISECDADLDCRTFDGLTPLHIAVARDFHEIATLLLACGADQEAEFTLDTDSTPASLCVSAKMRSILEGENPLEQYDIRSDYSSYIDDSEDICSLDPLVKMKLGRLLDSAQDGKDWYALAKRLGLGEFISLIEDCDKSPTGFLLENYSCLHGTVTGLKTALLEIGRQDAIDLLANGLRPDMHACSPKDVDVDIDRIDSAIESMTLSEQNLSVPGC